MSKRYSSLYRTPNDLYDDNAPVIVKAGALLKDNTNGSLYAQLKIRNISDKIINSVSVVISPFCSHASNDITTISYTFKNINANFDTEFGSKELINLSSTTAVSYDLRVSSVNFSDGTKWESNSEAMWASVASKDKASFDKTYKESKEKNEIKVQQDRNETILRLSKKGIKISFIINFLGILFLFAATKSYSRWTHPNYVEVFSICLLSFILPTCYFFILRTQKYKFARCLLVLTIVIIGIQVLGMLYCGDPFAPINNIKKLFHGIGGCTLIYYEKMMASCRYEFSYFVKNEFQFGLRSTVFYALLEVLSNLSFVVKNIIILIFLQKLKNYES